MSKQSDYLKQLQALEAQLNQANQPSQAEINMGTDYNRNRNWLLKGDYKNGQDIGAFTNLTPVAQQSRQMQLSAGGPSDSMASGTSGNPLAMHAAGLADQDATNKMWGGAFQDTLAGVQDNQSGLQNSLQNSYNQRQQAGIQNAQMLNQAYQNRPKSGWGSFWSGLVGAI